jgi:hypothetical protein
MLALYSLAQPPEDAPRDPGGAIRLEPPAVSQGGQADVGAAAARTALHPTEISRLARGVREPRLGTIVRLARGLEIGADKLVAGIR